MSTCPRLVRYGLAVLLACSPLACSHYGYQTRQAQYQAAQLYQQNQTLAAENSQSRMMTQHLQEQLGAVALDRDSLKKRVDSLASERQDLQQRYTSLVNRVKQNGSPLSPEATRQFEDLARRFPDFDFDPQTGVSKFHSDILFESGSAEIRPAAIPLLHEFAKILNNGDAQRLNVLVVGHTDDRPVVRPQTKAKHLDNWDLSVHRAVSVTREMSHTGLKDNRMGVAGYGPHQPLVPNSDDKSRQRNRRVEIFVLAPNAAVAGWDPAHRN